MTKEEVEGVLGPLLSFNRDNSREITENRGDKFRAWIEVELSGGVMLYISENEEDPEDPESTYIGSLFEGNEFPTFLSRTSLGLLTQIKKYLKLAT